METFDAGSVGDPAPARRMKPGAGLAHQARPADVVARLRELEGVADHRPGPSVSVDQRLRPAGIGDGVVLDHRQHGRGGRGDSRRAVLAPAEAAAVDKDRVEAPPESAARGAPSPAVSTITTSIADNGGLSGEAAEGPLSPVAARAATITADTKRPAATHLAHRGPATGSRHIPPCWRAARARSAPRGAGRPRRSDRATSAATRR